MLLLLQLSSNTKLLVFVNYTLIKTSLAAVTTELSMNSYIPETYTGVSSRLQYSYAAYSEFHDLFSYLVLSFIVVPRTAAAQL